VTKLFDSEECDGKGKDGRNFNPEKEKKKKKKRAGKLVHFRERRPNIKGQGGVEHEGPVPRKKAPEGGKKS